MKRLSLQSIRFANASCNSTIRLYIGFNNVAYLSQRRFCPYSQVFFPRLIRGVVGQTLGSSLCAFKCARKTTVSPPTTSAFHSSLLKIMIDDFASPIKPNLSTSVHKGAGFGLAASIEVTVTDHHTMTFNLDSPTRPVPRT